jgi:uncharacterized protein YaaQ
MKLLLAIVRNDCAADVVSSLNEQHFGVTRISSTGGFWRRGNATLLIGVEEAQIDQAMEIINKHAGPTIEGETAKGPFAPRRATIFVLDVDSFARY